ncbi:MAG: acyl-CoA/acyl-ACP dehydrogenase [Hamadaea sp.]|nr:acyl-CoA/acyl-ACP dehydrogenase [Hamadaea sp.]
MTASSASRAPREYLSRAREIAEDVLFPAAQEVDAAERVPASHLDLLAAEGFYGVAAPPEAGGVAVDGMGFAADLVATFASGCLATAFVWIQHHGPVLATAFSREPGVREKWLAPLAGGRVRGGIARAGARPGAAGLRVRDVPGGCALDGEVPWVTGWDLIDVVHVAALDDAGRVRFLLVDAIAGPSLRVRPNRLAAANASRTVTLTFDGHVVPADRFTGAEPYESWSAGEASGSALNGFLALGVVDRCVRLLDTSDDLAAQRDAVRADLLAADAAATPAARAAASELAMRAASTLAVQVGSRSTLAESAAARLVREAAFLLVFGSRPAIRAALLARLAPPA